MNAFKLLLVSLLGLVVLGGCGGRSSTGPLNAPTNLVAAPGAGQIVLTWTDNSTAEEGFRIFRRLEADTEFPTDAIGQVGTDITKYEDQAISSAESYVYSVQAFSSTGEGELSGLSAPAKATLGEGKVKLTVTRGPLAGEGVTMSSPAGINCIHPEFGSCSLDVDKDSTITLTADPNETSTPPTVFAGFSGACTTTQLTCEVIMDTAKDVTATYSPAQPGLTVQVSGQGRVFDRTTADEGGPYITCGTDGDDCSETTYWPVGSKVDLFATPEAGYRFTGWSNNCDRNQPDTAADRCNFTLGTSTVISATFEAIPDAPVIAFRPLNSGTEDLTYKVGTPLTLEWTVQNSPLDSLTLNGAALAANATSGGITLPATSEANIYRLEARNANETPGTATKTITTGEVPQIGEPAEQPTAASPPVQPNADGTYTLTWTPQTVAPGGVSRGDISAYTYTLTPLAPAGAARAVTLAASGSSRVLTLLAGTTPGRYRLDASNGFGTAPNAAGTGSDEFTIAAAPAAVVPNGTLTLTPPADVAGSYTLNWSATGTAPIAYSLQANAAPAVNVTALNGTTTVDPTITTTYSLVASNSAGPDLTPAVVTISAPAPVLTSDPAPPTPITSIERVVLNWSASTGTGPATFTLNTTVNGVTTTSDVTGEVTQQLSLVPGVTTSYSITMTTPVGSVTSAPVIVTVNPAVQAPEISFAPLGTPEDLTYAVSTPLTLNWTMQNGPMTSLTLNNNPLSAGAVSEPITLPDTATTTNYTLEARNANPTPGTATKAITTGAKPVISNVIVSTPGIGSSDYSVSWDVAGDGTISYVLLDPNGVEVAGITFGEDTFLFTPSGPGDYLLRGSNEFGDTPNAPGIGEAVVPIL